MKLGFVYNGRLVKKIMIGNSQELMLGRSSTCQIVLPIDIVSSYHAQLIRDGQGNLFLIDQNSTNGTFVNGQRLPPGKLYQIQPGSDVWFSNQGVRLVFNPDDAGFGSGGGFDPSGSGQTKPIKSLSEELQKKSEVVIGRAEESDIVLKSNIVSRRHAVVERKKNQTIVIRDLDSANGTFVNGKRITSATVITENDVILIGRFKLSLQGAATDLSGEIAIRVTSIAKKFGNGKYGLHTSTFDIRSNSLLAIMGPSGCGKSTLLKAMNGASPVTEGTVHVCGLELYANYDYLKTQIGYVPQDDIVHKELTVDQSLRYAARIRMPHKSDEMIDQRIQKVLEDLNISHIRHSFVGEISGGQRKRVSIAVEILNEPMILFLDEPTSPLDPQTIEDFLGSLRKLSEQGTTVVLVTHKPEDLNYVNDVMFLAEGGHITYYGKVNQYLSYFEVDDTVKVYSSLSGNRSQKWIDKYKIHNGSKKQSDNVTTKKLQHNTKINYFSQYWWLTMRYFTIKLNDRKNTLLMLAQALLIPLLICLIYDRLELSILFLMSVSAIWFGTNNAAREIVGELPIYARERMYNLGIFPYLFSKVTVLGAFAAVQSFIFVLILAFRFASAKEPDLSQWNSISGAYFWMFGLSLVATLYGLMLSAITSNTEKVMTLVPIALLPQIMLAGVLAKITNVLVEWLSYFTISRWGTEGFSLIQKNIDKMNPVMSANGELSSVYQKSDAAEFLRSQFHETAYKDFFGGYKNHLSPDILALLILALSFILVITLALKSKDSIK